MEIQKLQQIPPILQPTYPTLSPEKSEHDYRESRLVNICEIAAPDWDKASNSIDLEWLNAVRELRTVNEQLRSTRTKAATEYVKNNEKWRELQEKEENLRQSFIKFESFLMENEEKRKRARRKIIEERLLQEQRTRMLDDGVKQSKVLTDVRQKFDQKIKEYRIYEDFLNRVVVGEQKHFKTINDIIKRHMILLQTKDQVTAKRSLDMDALDEAKTQFSKLIDEKDLELMMLNSKLVELIVRHDRARNRALLWESTVMEIKDITEQRNMELVSVRVSMWRMYKFMCARKGQKVTCRKEDFEDQMAFIKKGLEELNVVLQRVEKLVGNTVYTGAAKRRKRLIKIDHPGEPNKQKKSIKTNTLNNLSLDTNNVVNSMEDGVTSAQGSPRSKLSGVAEEVFNGSLKTMTKPSQTSGANASGEKHPKRSTLRRSAHNQNQRMPSSQSLKIQQLTPKSSTPQLTTA